jgi:hypothetical protein
MAKLKNPPHIVERVLNHISGAQGGLGGVDQQYEYLSILQGQSLAGASFTSVEQLKEHRCLHRDL